MTEFLDANYDGIKKQASGIPATIKSVPEEELQTIDGKRLVILLGAGDSYAVAEYGKWAFLSASINAISISPPELSRIPLGKDCLVIGISASGRSLATIDALAKARTKGATTVVLTDNPEGKTSNVADRVWLTLSGIDTYNISPAVPTTSAMSYILKLVSLYQAGTDEKLLQDTNQLAEKGQEIIDWAEVVGSEIEKLISLEKPVYIISDGPNYVSALLGMMKINEYSLVKGIAMIREEFQHHCNLSINDDDRAILVSDSPSTQMDQHYMKVLTDTLKMQAYHLHTPDELGLRYPIVQSIANAIVLQMAAYHHVRKTDPEKTRFKMPHAEAFKIY
ncbi:MAG: SIS domain-containing protein [Candidatus Thorarchaeota archaeon]